MRNVTLVPSLLVLLAACSSAPAPGPTDAPSEPAPTTPAAPPVAQEPSGDFAFGAAPALRIRHGETQSITIDVTRAAGAVGDVRVTLEGLPDGVHAEPAMVGEGATKATLVVTADAGAKQMIGSVTFRGALGATEHTQPGKILLVGRPGELDTTFGVAGFADTGAWSWRSIRLADGSMLVAGGVGQQPAVFRMDPTGKLDTTFGDQGIARVPIAVGMYDEVDSVLVTADGHVVASGYRNDKATNKSKNLVVRFDATGKLDATFGAGGVVILPALGVESALGGGIFEAGGGALFFGGYDNDAVGCRVVVLKLDAMGALDATYGTGGAKLIPSASAPDPDFCVSAGVAMPGGGFVLGATGYHTQRMGAVRFDAQGQLDASWGTGGFAVAGAEGDGAWFYDLAVAPDGKLVLGGESFKAPEMTFARLGTDGKLDTTFGNGGLRTIDVGPMRSAAYSLAIAPDGSVVAGGYAETAANVVRLGLARLTPAGALDTSFGTGGSVVDPSFTTARAIALDGDGRIVFGTSVASPLAPKLMSVWQ